MTRPAIGPLRAPRSPSVVETELTGGLHTVAVRRRSVPLVELRMSFPVAAAGLQAGGACSGGGIDARRH